MNIKFNDKIRSIIVFSFAFLTLVSFIVINQMGKKQDETFNQDYIGYQQSLIFASEGKVEKSKSIMEDIYIRNENNYLVLYDYGLIQGMLQDYNKAEIFFQKAQDQNIYLTKDPLFLTQFGEILYRNKEYDKAMVYLTAAKSLNPKGDLITSINNLVKKIEAQNNK